LHTRPQTGPITIHCAAKLSVQYNEYMVTKFGKHDDLEMPQSEIEYAFIDQTSRPHVG